MFKKVFLNLKTITVLLFLFVIRMIPTESKKKVELYTCHNGNKDCFIKKDVGVTLVLTSLNGSQIYCLGVFIPPTLWQLHYGKWYHVLTVASCFDNKFIENVQVRFSGTPKNKSTPNKYFRKVEKIIYHPSYNKINHLADIALVRMDRCIDQIEYPFLFVDTNPSKDESNTHDILYWNFNPSFNEQQITEDKLYSVINQTTYYSTNGLDCSPEKNSTDQKKADKYSYLFMCASIDKSEKVDVYGAILLYSQLLDVNTPGMNKIITVLPVVGLLTDSYMADNNQQILKFTVMFWYKPWIYSTLKTDLKFIKEREKNRANLTRVTRIESNVTTENIFQSNAPDSIIYYSDSETSDKHHGTSNEQWGDNPCIGSIVSGEHKIMLLLLLFVYGFKILSI